MHWFNRYLLTLAILFCQKNMLKSCIFKSIDFTIRSRLGHTVSTYVKIWIVLCVHCIICEFTWNWIKVMGFVKNVSQTLNYCRGYWNSSAYFNPLCRLSHHEQMFSEPTTSQLIEMRYPCVAWYSKNERKGQNLKFLWEDQGQIQSIIIITF